MRGSKLWQEPPPVLIGFSRVISLYREVKSKSSVTVSPQEAATPGGMVALHLPKASNFNLRKE